MYASVRTYLMSSLSFLFSLPLFLPLSLTIIFSGQKQPCILHLLLFPMKQQHCLYPVCHRPLPGSYHLGSFSFVPHALLMCTNACQVRCSSGKPTPVTLHSHCFQTYMYMYHSSQSHYKIPHLFPITYRHVHENDPSVSSGHKSYYTVHVHTNKVIVLKSKRLNFFKWLIKTIIITPQVRRNSPHKHHHTGPHMAQLSNQRSSCNNFHVMSLTSSSSTTRTQLHYYTSCSISNITPQQTCTRWATSQLSIPYYRSSSSLSLRSDKTCCCHRFHFPLPPS